MSVMTLGTKGLDVFPVSVETDISRGLYHFDIVGLGDKTVAESRARILSAIRNSGFRSPKTAQQKITVLLSPAGIKKEGSHFDLPVAISYLHACGLIKSDLRTFAIVGELSLQGKIRPVKNILLMALAAKQLGVKNILLPEENREEAELVAGINVHTVPDIRQAVAFLNGRSRDEQKQVPTINKCLIAKPRTSFMINKVGGQEQAKRALEIALAGKHHLAFFGPPGVGKSLLAKSAAELLPELSTEEAIECRIIRESTGEQAGQPHDMYNAPFRDPHHTASYSALLGTHIRAGEISLAHKGILFMDEFPEYDRRTLEALRQPMEDGCVKNHRAGGNLTLPAECIVIAAMNMCPCGNHGSMKKRCTCTAIDMLRYSKKISGPLSDRIDIWVHLQEILKMPDNNETPHRTSGRAIKERIAGVRKIQSERHKKIMTAAPTTKHTTPCFFKTEERREARLTLIHEIRKSLREEVVRLVNNAMKELGISPRAADGVLLVARTIADLDYTHSPAKNPANDILLEHILEALGYRKKV